MKENEDGEQDIVAAITEATDKLGTDADTDTDTTEGKPADPKPADEPEAKPAPEPAKPDAKPPEPKDDDDDLPPENATPNRENFRILREKAKELKRQAKEMELKMVGKTDPSAAPASAPAKETRPLADPNPAPKLDIDRVADYLGKGRAGELGDQSAEYADLAQKALLDFSPAELAQAYDRAKRGALGPHSEDLADVLKETLPLVTAQWTDRRAAQDHQARLQKESVDSGNRALQRYPDLAKQDSPITAEFRAVFKEYVGEYDENDRLVKPGKFPQLIQRVDLPEIIAEFAEQRMKAKETDSLRAIVKERDDLRAKLNRITSPESVRRSPQSAGKPDPDEADMEELREVIRRESAALRG